MEQSRQTVSLLREQLRAQNAAVSGLQRELEAARALQSGLQESLSQQTDAAAQLASCVGRNPARGVLREALELIRDAGRELRALSAQVQRPEGAGDAAARLARLSRECAGFVADAGQ